MILKPVTSEKAVRMIDVDNTLTFEVDMKFDKPQIKSEVESLFKVKVSSIRTHLTKNKKYAYVRLIKENPAIDIATKLGMI